MTQKKPVMISIIVPSYNSQSAIGECIRSLNAQRIEEKFEILEFSPNNPKKEVKFVSAANGSFSREIVDKYGLFPDIRAGEEGCF